MVYLNKQTLPLFILCLHSSSLAVIYFEQLDYHICLIKQSCCQPWEQVDNTNSPSSSVVTTIRNHLDTCACAAFTSRGYYSRAAFISFKRFTLCGYYSRAATIRGLHLFKENNIFWSRIWQKMYSCLPIDHIHTWKALLVSSVSRESLSSIWKPCCWANSAAPLSTNMLNEACSSTHRATDIGLAYLKSEHIYKRDKNTSKTCAPKEARKPKQHYQKQAKAQGSNRTSF